MFIVYRFFDVAGKLLYIGRTIRLQDRMNDHLNHAVWFEKVTRIELARFKTFEAMCAAERRAIAQEHPIHNIVGNGKVVVGQRLLPHRSRDNQQIPWDEANRRANVLNSVDYEKRRLKFQALYGRDPRT